MLGTIEQKLTSILGDDLAARAHLDVLEAPGPPAPVAGRGAVLVALAEVTPASLFEREQFNFNGAQSRRILPLQFNVNVDYALRPAGNNAAQLASARELLLNDISLIGHGLARPELINGKAFAVTDPDPGFRVLTFALTTGALIRDADADGLLSARLQYRGSAEIWPPGVTQDEGEILAIDTVSVALPLSIVATNPVLRAGQSAIVNTRSLPTSRLQTREPSTSGPLQLAVTVLSDAPPAQRGTIVGGSAGLETGFRIIDVTPPQTAITYQAPAAALSRGRVEYVAVHLATPDGHRGVFIGSIALRLEPG
ncbi:MAG: hypothetical protein JWM78_2114 [Verrucomicrobiaceae bacterium]|nr:hypothetical protein [Verrucomicrobiaceae bacterium]